LPTPDFVSAYLARRTLDPAIEVFGLETVRVIDPACGTGQHLVAAFRRLCALWRERAPELAPERQAQLALEQIAGVDVSPHAVALARARLSLAYLEEVGDVGCEVPQDSIRLAVGDSLLGGERNGLAAYASLRARYHAVLCTPPPLTCKDAALRESYAARFPRSQAALAPLAVPFTELCFELAAPGGIVGLLLPESVTRRAFGKRLVDDFLPTKNVQDVISLAGTFLPGIGLPSFLLLGRNEAPTWDDLTVVLTAQGEPTAPADPALGRVWTTIAAHAERPPYRDGYIHAVRRNRTALAQHPWSLRVEEPRDPDGRWTAPVVPLEGRRPK
jgi:SAM-dependent methyltransferase